MRHAVSQCDSAPLVDRSADGYDAVVPQTGDQFEPLHAVLPSGVLQPDRAAPGTGERRVISFFADVRLRPVPEADWRVIDPEGRSLSNLNTPDDLNQLSAPAANG